MGAAWEALKKQYLEVATQRVKSYRGKLVRAESHKDLAWRTCVDFKACKRRKHRDRASKKSLDFELSYNHNIRPACP